MAIYINTNQNVQINFEISSIGARLIAYLIDLLIIAGISFGFFIISDVLELGSFQIILFAIIFLYPFLCEIFMNGQTFGKRARDMRVMRKDGSAASVFQYFLRFLLLPIDSIYGLGLAVVFISKNNQRLGDLAAGTIVVNVKSENSVKNQIKSRMSLKDKTIRRQEVGVLNDQEIQIIIKVLKSRINDQHHRNVVDLANKIAEKMNVSMETPSCYAFLKQVVQDYYRLNALQEEEDTTETPS